MQAASLSLQDRPTGTVDSTKIVVLGEVLWDLLPDHTCLGGAPLNFAVHLGRLGYEPLLISAVGSDELGLKASHVVQGLGVNVGMLQRADRLPTGTATVAIDSGGQPTFTIHRPAAYDAVRIDDDDIRLLAGLRPKWFYFGTLFPSLPDGKATLLRLLDGLPTANRFYDVNLRPGFDSPALVTELLARAGVVKVNETEMAAVAGFCHLPSSMEEFCRAGSEKFGWRAICVTLGEQGCAALVGGEYVVAKGHPVAVADAVGAGDAFAASFLHGLAQQWPVRRVADFANRVGSLVASRVGATPEWHPSEMAET
jgi:fructokinase